MRARGKESDAAGKKKLRCSQSGPAKRGWMLQSVLHTQVTPTASHTGEQASERMLTRRPHPTHLDSTAAPAAAAGSCIPMPSHLLSRSTSSSFQGWSVSVTSG